MLASDIFPTTHQLMDFLVILPPQIRILWLGGNAYKIPILKHNFLPSSSESNAALTYLCMGNSLIHNLSIEFYPLKTHQNPEGLVQLQAKGVISCVPYLN